MLFYLKTEIPIKLLYPYLKRYINMNSYNCNNILLNDYLRINYNISLSNTLRELSNNIKITNINNNLIQIYFNKNKIIGKNKLEDILSFLEYGNLDVRPPKLISKIMNNSLIMLNNAIGGY